MQQSKARQYLSSESWQGASFLGKHYEGNSSYIDCNLERYQRDLPQFCIKTGRTG